MRAIGYLSERNSADVSLIEQNANFLAYCHEHGYQPMAAFLDVELSPERSRTGLEQLLRHLRQDVIGFTFVVTQSLSHLGHDPTQAVRAALQLRARGAHLISLSEGPIDDDALVALWRRHQHGDSNPSVRQLRQQERAEQGLSVGPVPYGYVVGEDGRYTPDEAESSIVRRIFDLYLRESFGIRRITQRLNEEGVRTRRGGNWSMTTIRDLLCNPVYLGRYEQLGVRMEQNHPPLVSEQDFELVAQQMAKRRTATGVSNPSEFLLAGLVWWGEDGAHMQGVTRRQQWRKADGDVVHVSYRYYQSEVHRNRAMGQSHSRRADELEAEVVAQLRGERDGGQSAVVDFSHNATALAAETAVALAHAESHLRSIDRQLAQLLDDAAGGEHPATGLQEAGGRLVAEWEAATDDLARLRGLAVAHEQEAERRRRRDQRLERVRTDWNELSFAQRRELIEQLVNRVIVTEQSVTTQLKV